MPTKQQKRAQRLRGRMANRQICTGAVNIWDEKRAHSQRNVYGTSLGYYGTFVRQPPNPTRKHADGTRKPKGEKKRAKRIERLAKIFLSVTKQLTAFRPSPKRLRALEAI